MEAHKDYRKLIKIFISFFKIGLFTIGGGLVMIPIMHREFVDKQKWVNDEKMIDIFSVAQALPGVVALNSSVYIGYELFGIAGAAVAAIGVMLPSLLCILAIYFLLSNIGGNVYLDRFYTGVRAAVVALIALAAVKLGKSAIKDTFGVFIALFGIAATILLKLDIVTVVSISGFMGYLYYCRYLSIKEGRKNGS